MTARVRFKQGDCVQVVISPEMLARHRLLKPVRDPQQFVRYVVEGDPEWFPHAEVSEQALLDDGWVIDASVLKPCGTV